MTATFVDLDVRPVLRSGGEPFDAIMETVAGLGPEQGLRLVAPFRPTPLMRVLGSRGFIPEARELGNGDWEVLFRRAERINEIADAPETRSHGGQTNWPKPIRHLDNRDLDLPEPMTRILAAIEEMRQGEVLSALLRREPVFLIPELKKRGHDWRGAFEGDGKTYRILVRVGSATEATK